MSMYIVQNSTMQEKKTDADNIITKEQKPIMRSNRKNVKQSENSISKINSKTKFKWPYKHKNTKAYKQSN